MQTRKAVSTIAKGAGVTLLAVALASPALANPRLAELLAALRAASQPPIEPTERLVVMNRAQFFEILERDDPRSPN